jgi:hypothetical protein
LVNGSAAMDAGHDNVASDSAGESLVASGGFIFARMAIATQIN